MTYVIEHQLTHMYAVCHQASGTNYGQNPVSHYVRAVHRNAPLSSECYPTALTWPHTPTHTATHMHGRLTGRLPPATATAYSPGPAGPCHCYCLGGHATATAWGAMPLLLPGGPCHCYCLGGHATATACGAMPLLLRGGPCHCYCLGGHATATA